jgi:DNA modification methylase
MTSSFRAGADDPTRFVGLRDRELSIQSIAPRDLKRNPKNPRIHSEKQIRQLAESIRAFGFNTPILVDSGLKVIAGHGRVQAAELLGMKLVPTIRLEHLSPPQATAFMIADNKLTENSEWDERLLGQQLKILSEVELNFSLETIGFEMGEIDILIAGASPATDSDPDREDALPETTTAVPVSRTGDLWLLGRNRIVCGNSLIADTYDVLMDGEGAAMVFSDPPYNVPISGHATGLGAIRHQNFKMASGEMSEAEFTDFLAQVCMRMAARTVEGSLHFLCIDWRHLSELLVAGKQVYSELKNVCVWVKDNGGMGSLYRSQHELVLIFKNGEERHTNNVQLGRYGRYRTNVWNYPGANSFSRTTQEGNLLELHPTVKPVALIADAMMDCSTRGGLILDPFLGSGSTVIAAERTGRICYGIELDPVYVDTILRRWQAFTGVSATHGSSGRRFAELEEASHAK